MNKKTLLVIGVAALLATGCAELFQGIITVTEVRDDAMKELAQLSKQGLIDSATDLKITNADARYVSAAKVAERALVAYKNGGDRAAYVAALTAVKEAVGEILAILNPLNTKAANKLETQLVKASKP